MVFELAWATYQVLISRESRERTGGSDYQSFIQEMMPEFLFGIVKCGILSHRIIPVRQRRSVVFCSFIAPTLNSHCIRDCFCGAVISDGQP